MKTVAVCQARMGSQRLPGKVMMDIAGRITLDWVVEAARRAPGVDEVIVATSTLAGDDAIFQWAQQRGINCFRGSETDVLSRYLGAVHATQADVIVRLTSDCPFLDPNVIGEVIKLREMKDVAYATNTDPPTYPDGLDVEVFTKEALEQAHREATRATDRDTVTRWIVRNRHRLPAANLTCPLPGLIKERWVLDSPEDLQLIREIAKRLGDSGTPPSYLQILLILDREPWIRSINSKFSRNERFYEALGVEQGVKRSYAASKMALDNAEHIIPLGAQTFSKSKLMFPEGASPLFVTHGDGAYVFDVDGNDYVDCVGALLPNILGYRDPDVDAAIRDQLDRGISFSLSTTLETELAERLSTYIPCAEMVRFGKNGSDVTTAAVRLARHITGRDKVMVGGYHGWHDWSMANTARNAGIPQGVRDLSVNQPAWGSVNWGMPGDEPAAIIIEPEFATKSELRWLREMTETHGIILIFDEIITGFRCGIGGLQKVHDITPDLATFGKSMANGMPISALVGQEKFMKMLPEISFSGTFFGETLSIAAAIATIDKLVKENVPNKLKADGGWLYSHIAKMIGERDLGAYISLYGPSELNRIRFKNNAIQSLFIQEMAKNGVLIIGSHNLSLAHGLHELGIIVKAWEVTLDAIKNAVGDDILEYLDGGLIKSAGVR